jgi:hypothetical protein
MLGRSLRVAALLAYVNVATSVPTIHNETRTSFRQLQAFRCARSPAGVQLTCRPPRAPRPRSPRPPSVCVIRALCVAGTTADEMTALLGPVNAECCDEPGEDCSGGYPSVCNAGCKTVLQPFKENCDGLLTSNPMWAPIRTIINAAWETCPTTCADDASFQSYMNGLNAACCPFGEASCPRGSPTSCDATCAAVLLPLRQDCFTYLDTHPSAQSAIEGLARTCAMTCLPPLSHSYYHATMMDGSV